MIIKNRDILATTPLRKAALKIAEAGLAALNTQHIVRRSMRVKGNTLRILDLRIDLSLHSGVHILGFGKAATGMAAATEKILGQRIKSGFILDRNYGRLQYLTSLLATHPHPTEGNVAATEKVIEWLKSLDRKALVLVLISGGGSAMLTAPYKISVDEKAKIAKKLMQAGATIGEINIVRKHLSRIKGGRIVQYAYPAKVVSIVLSDVVGNDLSTIASGPTVFDPSTNQDARAVLTKYKLSTDLELTESPKDKNLFENVKNILIGDVGLGLGPMEKQARQLGFATNIFSSKLTGKANDVGPRMLSKLRPGLAMLAAGETTVLVLDGGSGGRNQQLVLSALPKIKEGQLILSINTDGHDNSDVAGAIGDTETLAKARQKNLDPVQYAQSNNSYAFLRAVGDQIITGELESNFADLVLCLSQNNS